MEISKGKIITSLLWSALFSLSISSNASPIIVEATGIGTYRDFVTNTILYNAAITQTWRFDTDDVPADIYGLTHTGSAKYESTTSWISATIAVNGGTVADENAILDEPVDSAMDTIFIWDNYGGWDQYRISSYGDDYSGEYDSFVSRAYFNDYLDDVIHGLDFGQLFEWAPNHVSDVGVGYAFWYDKNGTTWNPYAKIEYNLTSIRAYAAPVPEPCSIALLVLGIIGLGLSLRKY
jgi:hypothetical protein